KGERKQPVPEKGVWHRQERNYGSFARTFTLPYPVDADKVDARLENGVLLIRLAKHESARPRKIPGKAGKCRRTGGFSPLMLPAEENDTWRTWLKQRRKTAPRRHPRSQHSAASTSPPAWTSLNPTRS